MTEGMQVLEEVLKTLPQGIAIDVASGAGTFAAAIDECSNCSWIVAADAYLKPLEMVRDRLSSSIIPAAMDGGKLAFPDCSFSAATISNSLHHMENPDEVLSEMVRVLRPGGMLVINEMFSSTDQTPAQQTHNLMHNWWGAVDIANGIFHNPVYRLDELKLLGERSGIENFQSRTFEDLSGDPFDGRVKEHILKAWENYMGRAGNSDLLEESGKEALSHFNQHGFTGARSVLVYGYKPV